MDERLRKSCRPAPGPSLEAANVEGPGAIGLTSVSVTRAGTIAPVESDIQARLRLPGLTDWTDQQFDITNCEFKPNKKSKLSFLATVMANEPGGDVLDDVIGPLVNQRVILTAVRTKGRLLYRDIEADE